MEILDPQRVKQFAADAATREAIRRHREEGDRDPFPNGAIPPEWRQRLTNVNREHDRFTREFRQLYAPYHAHPDAWFMIVAARLLNLPATLAEVQEALLPWQRDRFVAAIAARRARGEKIEGGAYMTPAPPRAGADKYQYIADAILAPAWADCEFLRPRVSDSLLLFDLRLAKAHGLGSFLRGQIIADLKIYQPLCRARDRLTWCASGPGSRKGLNIICGRPADTPWREWEWWRTCDALRREVEVDFRAIGIDPCDAQSIQHWLCEYSKLASVRSGGRPKRWYQPRQLSLFAANSGEPTPDGSPATQRNQMEH